MPHDPKLEIRRRRLPHWRLQGSCYFITFRAKAGKLSLEEVQMVRNHIVSGDPAFYTLFAVVIMPDHVHILLKPNSEQTLERILKGIKGVTARHLNEGRDEKGPFWQEEYFDRIVRDEDDLKSKLEYMLKNPIKAGLTDDPWSYPGWFLKRTE